MAQASGVNPSLSDKTKKSLAAVIKPRKEAVPGLMATRNQLKNLRQSTLPKEKRGK